VNFAEKNIYIHHQELTGSSPTGVEKQYKNQVMLLTSY